MSNLLKLEANLFKNYRIISDGSDLWRHLVQPLLKAGPIRPGCSGKPWIYLMLESLRSVLEACPSGWRSSGEERKKSLVSRQIFPCCKLWWLPLVILLHTSRKSQSWSYLYSTIGLLRTPTRLPLSPLILEQTQSFQPPCCLNVWKNPKT